MAVPLFPLQKLHRSCHHSQHYLDRLYVSSVDIPNEGYVVPFQVPTILSLHLSVGFHSEPVSLKAPVTLYGFSCEQCLLNHTNDDFSSQHISMLQKYRPVHSRICQFQREHSNHRQFIDPRHVGNTIHLWTAFVWALYFFHLRLLSAAFTELLTGAVSCPRQSEYQGRRFRALPRHSTYRIVSSPHTIGACAFHTGTCRTVHSLALHLFK